MTEDKLIDDTLARIDDTGTLKAYEYLKANLGMIDDMTSQVYNYLYCLAATSGKNDEAISWLNEAIIKKEMWYRPDVFEDEDLDTIRNKDEFKICQDISTKRYEEALEIARTEFTWKCKNEDRLMVVLHGNQQNNDISKRIWSGVEIPNYQIDYLQSKELDSIGIFRWSDDGDGPMQLNVALGMTRDFSYEERILVGFSAGCNTILRSMLLDSFTCDKIILFSPWIPVVETAGNEVITALKDKKVDVVIICGELDEDCMPQCQLFESKSNELGLKCEIKYIKDMGHEYPANLKEIINQNLQPR